MPVGFISAREILWYSFLLDGLPLIGKCHHVDQVGFIQLFNPVKPKLHWHLSSAVSWVTQCHFVAREQLRYRIWVQIATKWLWYANVILLYSGRRQRSPIRLYWCQWVSHTPVRLKPVNSVAAVRHSNICVESCIQKDSFIVWLAVLEWLNRWDNAVSV